MPDQPLIVTGAPGSGVGLAGRFVASLGVTLAPDAEVAGLHGQLARVAAGSADGPVGDWGWTAAEQLDSTALADLQGTATAAVGAWQRSGWWGWHDPRSALVLDWWDELVPDARVLFVYRTPWDAQATIERSSGGTLAGDAALRVWAFFNRRVLDFHERNPERCLLVEGPAVDTNPHDVAGALLERFGLAPSDPSLPSGPGREVAAAWVAAARNRGPSRPGRRIDGEPVHKLLESMPADVRLLFGELDRAAGVRERHEPPLADLIPRVGPAPRISVVVPCRDDGEYLVDALASLRLCDDEPIELLVVDDGSTDERTGELLAALESLDVMVLRTDARGLAAARNAGLAATTAPYVLPLDADNLLRPGWLGEAAAVLDADERVAVVHTDAQRFGLVRGRWEVEPHDVRTLLRGNTIDTCALVRRSALEAAGGYDEHLPTPAGEDWDLWLALTARRQVFVKLDVVGFDYRVRADSLTTLGRDPAAIRALFRHEVAKHHDLYTSHLADVVADHVDAVVALRARIEVLEAQVAEASSLRAELAAATAELADRRASVDDMSAEVESLRVELAAAGRAARVDAERRAALEDEVARHDRAGDLARQKVAWLLSELDHQRAEHAGEVRRMAEAADQLSAELGDQLRDSEGRARELRAALDAVEASRSWRLLRMALRAYGVLRRRPAR